MRGLIGAILAVSALWGAQAMADDYVNGYMRSDGTYVQGYYRSSPNSTRLDNYSTRGNVNPYTGRRGYRDSYDSYSAPRPSYSDSYRDGMDW